MSAILRKFWHLLGINRESTETVDPVFDNLIASWSSLEPSLCVNSPDRREFSIEQRIAPGIALGTYAYDDFEGIIDCIFRLAESKNLGRVMQAINFSNRGACKRLLRSYVSQIADRRSIAVNSVWITIDGRKVIVDVAQNSSPFAILLTDGTWVSRDLFLGINDRGQLMHTKEFS